MNNIFEGAKFGDKYINRAGKILIFQKIWDGYANLFSENSVWSCPLDGKNGEVENEFDIIGKHQEPIDEDKLDQKKIVEKAWCIFEEMVDECEGKGYCEKRYITKEQFKSTMEE